MAGENEEKIPSVADSVLAAFEDHEDKSDANAGAPPGTAAASKTTPPVAVDSTADADKKASAASSDTADKKSSTDSQGESKDKTGGTTAETVQAPASWDAASKEQFAKLPLETQKYIAKRESERDGFVSKTGEEFANYRKRFDDLDRVLEPKKTHFDRMGMSPAQVVNQLLALADQADRDFPSFIKEQARLRNFDLKTLAPASADAQNYVDPVVAQLQEQIASLTAHINNQVATQHQTTTNTLVKQIEDFRDEKDDKGNLLRPHYPKLEGEMEPFILSIRKGNPNLAPREVLQQAYDRVLWANPELRGELIERERKAAADKFVKEEKERADKAKNVAQVSHKGSPVGVGTSTQTETVEETLRNTMAAMGF